MKVQRKLCSASGSGSWQQRLLLAALPILIVPACNRTQPNKAAEPAKAAAPAGVTAAGVAGGATKLYGEPLAAAATTALSAVLANPEPVRGKTITVEGQVRKACTRKGCWMELASSTKPGSPGCRVTFKDYGFFVPTDSAGAQARVQGVVEVDTLSAAAVRHYEEEGAVFPNKKPDGTAPEVRLVATGVELTRDKNSANN